MRQANKSLTSFVDDVVFLSSKSLRKKLESLCRKEETHFLFSNPFSRLVIQNPFLPDPPPPLVRQNAFSPNGLFFCRPPSQPLAHGIICEQPLRLLSKELLKHILKGLSQKRSVSVSSLMKKL